MLLMLNESLCIYCVYIYTVFRGYFDAVFSTTLPNRDACNDILYFQGHFGEASGAVTELSSI